MSAWVSPPQDSVSHMVEVAAIIAHAASTAFPPCWKILAPAVAASGLPVTAIQCRPCSAGFWVRAWASGAAAPCNTAPPNNRAAPMRALILRSPGAPIDPLIRRAGRGAYGRLEVGARRCPDVGETE